MMGHEGDTFTYILNIFIKFYKNQENHLLVQLMTVKKVHKTLTSNLIIIHCSHSIDSCRQK